MESEGNFDTLIGGLLVGVFVLFGYGYWHSKKDEDFVVKEQSVFVPKQQVVVKRQVKVETDVSFDWNY